MDYPTLQYNVPMLPPESGSTSSKTIITTVIIVLVLVVAIAVGIGVGLGVGLANDSGGSLVDTSGSSGSNSGGSSSGGSSSGGSSSSGSNYTYSILSAPTVNCTYNGSATCGCSATQPTFATPRIYQGYTTVSNSWPWMVAVTVNNGNSEAFCGGFLISYQHVVTAGHCVFGQSASAITIYAGIQKVSLRNNGQSRVVANYTVHPSYSDTTYVNDIAVLTLQSPLNETSTVGKCCLTSDTSLPSIDERGVIIGWGRTKSTDTTISDDLQQAVILVQNPASCASASTSNIRFCAGYNGTDTCYGDSGGPFMTSLNNSWTCTGITSSGPKCGQYGLYTRVSAFRSFITSVTNV